MSNEPTRRFATRAFWRSPEKTWHAFRLMREGQVEDGLRLLDQLAEDDRDPTDWCVIDVDWLLLAACALTSPEGSPRGNVPLHETWQ